MLKNFGIPNVMEKVDVLTMEYATFQMLGSLRPLSTLPYPLR